MSYCHMNQVNQHLLCALCSGYLVDATAIIECLHTFCRSCIVRYLESSQTCPVCDVPLHENNPLLGIRSDVTLQRLVYKLVPDVYQEEVQRRYSFYKSLIAEGKTVSKDVLLKDIEDATTGHKIYSRQEMFSVSLRHSICSGSVSEIKDSDDMVETRYLLCPASLSVKHLKKLVTNKLDIPASVTESYKLNLFHSNELLDDDYTLMDVAYITDWSGTSPLQVDYTLERTSCQLESNFAHSTMTSKKKKAIMNQHIGTTVCAASGRFRLTGGKKCNWTSSLQSAKSVKHNKDLKVSHKKSSLQSTKHVDYKKNSKVSPKTSSSHKVKADTLNADYKQPSTKNNSLCKVKDQDLSNESEKIRTNCNDCKTSTKKLSSLQKKCSKESAVNIAAGANSKKMSVPKIVLSCSYPPEIKRSQNDVNMKLTNACEKAVRKSKKASISRNSASKSDLNWQKNVLSKLTIAKTSKPGKVHISNLNISKVSALKYLLVPKINMWKDRMPLYGLMKKHSKSRRLLGKMSASHGEITNLSTALSGEEVITPKHVVNDIKDVVSSSSNCDSLTANNDNVVSSSTSSSVILAGNEYDYDDEQVTSADEVISTATMKSVRLLQRSAVQVLEEGVQSDCKTSNEEDKTTLCVPIRLGEHGELLLRLPQNVSVECSFRPVTSDANNLSAELNEPVGTVGFSRTSSQLEQLQPGRTSSESDDNCGNSVAVAATHSVSEDIASATPVSQLVTACTQSDVPTSNANDASCVGEQPDISLFPFVTVSPSRRKLVVPIADDSSQGGCTSPSPLVSSSLASPVDRSTSSASDSHIMSRSPEQLAAVTRCEIIKVPVYTATFRDNKADVKNLRGSQCVLGANVLDLTVSQNTKQPVELVGQVNTPSKQTATCKQRSCTMKSTSRTVPQTSSTYDKSMKISRDDGVNLLEPKCSNTGVAFTHNHPSAVPIPTKKTKLVLRRCDDVCPGKLNTTTTPTTKRLKLMCNGITIYRTLDDCSDSKSRTGKHRSSHSKSFEVQSDKQTNVDVGKIRRPSLPDKLCHEPTASSDLIQSTSDNPIKVDPVIKSLDVVASNEPLELTTPKVQERYREKEYEEFALDLTVNNTLNMV